MRRVLTAILLGGLVLPWAGRAASGRSVRFAPAQDAAQAAAQRLCARPVVGLRVLHAWAGAETPGLELVTDHYRLCTTLLDPGLLERLPSFLEAAHTAYGATLDTPVTSRSRSAIYLFADRTQWEAFTRAFAGAQAEVLCRIRRGAYCHRGACVAYDIGPERTLAALAHEGWHQFMTRHFTYRLPSWLDEGLAMQFEAFVDEGGGWRFGTDPSPYRLDGLRAQIDQGRFLSLTQVLTTSPGEVMAQDNAAAVLGFYSQAYALVRFLRDGQGGRYRPRLDRLLQDGCAGRWPVDAVTGRTAADRNQPRTVAWNRRVGQDLFEAYISADPERVAGSYLAYCRRLVDNARDPGSTAEPEMP